MGGHVVDWADLGDEAGLRALAEERVDGLAASLAVVEGPLVDVHSDELVGEIGVEVSAELESILDGLFAVVE